MDGCRVSSKISKIGEQADPIEKSRPPENPGTGRSAILQAGPPVKITVNTPVAAEAGDCFGPFVATAIDKDGNMAAPSDGAEIFSVASAPTDSVFLDSLCTQMAPDNGVMSDAKGQKAAFFMNVPQSMSRMVTIEAREVRGRFAVQITAAQPARAEVALRNSFSAGDCVSGTIRLVDKFDTVVKSSSPISVSLAIEGVGAIFSDGLCKQPMTSLDVQGTQTFFVEGISAGSGTLSATPKGMPESEVAFTILSKGTPKISLSPPPGNTVAGSCAAVRVQTIEADGYSHVAQTPINILIESSQIGVFSDATCTTLLSPKTVTIPEDGTHTTFFVKSDQISEATIQGSATGFVADSRTITIVAAEPSHLSLEAFPESMRIGDCLTILARTKDRFGNVSPVTRGTDVALTASGGGGIGTKFFSGGGCSQSPIAIFRIPSGSSLGAFSISPGSEGTLSVTATPDGLNAQGAGSTVSGSGASNVTPPPPEAIRLAMESAATSTAAGLCFRFSVKTLNASGATTPLTQPLTITPKNDIGIANSFFLDSNCSSNATTAQIAAGVDKQDLFFRSTQIGPVILSVEATDPTGAKITATKGILVKAATPSHLEVGELPSGAAAQVCVGPIPITLFDAFGNPSYSTTPISVALESLGEVELQFFAGSTCAAPVASIGIASNRNGSTFFLKGASKGTVAYSLTGSGGGTASASGNLLDAPSLHLSMTGPDLIRAGSCVQYQVASLDAEGNRRVLESGELQIGAKSNTPPGLFSDENCKTALSTPLTLDGTHNPAVFSTRHTIPGSLDLSAQAPGEKAAGMTIEVVAGPPTQISFSQTGPGELGAGTCAGPYLAELSDEFGNSSNAKSPVSLTANFSGIDGARIFSERACSATGASIPAGRSSGQFFIRSPTTGTLNAQLASGNMLSNARTFTVTTNGSVTLALLGQPVRSADFGKVVQGESASLSFTLKNSSKTSAASGISLTLSGGSFSLDRVSGDSGCSTLSGLTLTPEKECAFKVLFSPSGTERSTGTLAFSFEFEGGTSQKGDEVSLSGAGDVPREAQLVATTQRLDFGELLVGQKPKLSFSLENRGTQSASGIQILGANAPFAVSGALTGGGACDTLGVSEACTITVEASPVAAGSTTGTLDFSHEGSNGRVLANSRVSLLVSSKTPAELSLSQSSLSFPNTRVNQISGAQSLELKNTGSLPATDISISAQGEDFIVDRQGCGTSLAVGGTCTVSVRFRPKTSSSFSDVLKVEYLAAPDHERSISATLSGNAADPAKITVDPRSVEFDATILSQAAAPIPILITNDGGEPSGTVTLSASAPFSVTPASCADLLPGRSCLAKVGFRPTVPGESSGDLTVGCQSNSQCASVPLSGSTTAESSLSVSPGSLEFERLNVGQRSSKFITLSNSGTAPIRIEPPLFQSPNESLTFLNGCPQSLIGGATCQVLVTYSPTRSGAANNTANIKWNPGSQVQTSFVVITGEAEIPARVALSPAELVFPPTTVGGTSVERQLTITNSGGETASEIRLQGVQSGLFTLQTSTCGGEPASLAPGASCTMGIVFSPIAVGLTSHSIGGTFAVDDKIQSAGSVTLNGTGTGTASLEASSFDLNFGVTRVGASAKGTLRITNRGNGPATQVSFVTPPSAPFSLVSTLCSLIEPDGECILAFKFSPQSVGSPTQSLSLRYFDGSSSQTLSSIQLAGTTGANFTLTPGSLNFENVTVRLSKDLAVTIINSGALALTVTGASVLNTSGAPYSVSTAGCGSLAVGASCQLIYTYAPTTPSVRQTATSTVTFSDSNGIALLSPSISLSGSATALAELSGGPGKIEFDDIAVNATSPQQNVLITNDGEGEATEVRLNPLSAHFVIGYGTCGEAGFKLAPGASCSPIVKFKPGSAGLFSEQLSATYQNGAGQRSIPIATVTGRGIGAGTLSLSLSKIAFGSKSVGQTGTQSLTLTNGGTGEIRNISFQDPISSPFGSGSLCPTIAPGGNCTLNLSFSPSQTGAFQDGFQLLYFDGLTTQSTSQITLTGDTGPSVEVSPSSLSFGNVLVGRSSDTRSVTITNRGAVSITASLLSYNGSTATPAGFTLTNHTCGTLSPGASCSVGYRFTPTTSSATSSFQARYQFAVPGNASVETTYSGSGSGIGNGALVASPSSHDFGTLAVGTAPEVTVRFTNTGGGGVVVSRSPSISQPFSIVANTCATGLSIIPGEFCDVRIRYTPTTQTVSPHMLIYTLEYRDSLGAPRTTSFDLRGSTTQPPGRLVLTPGPTHNFPILTVPNSATVGFTVSNTGSGPLTINNLFLTETLNSQLLTMDQNCCSNPSPSNGLCATPTVIPVGGSCRANVTFTAKSQASGSYFLKVVSSDSQVVASQGTYSATNGTAVLELSPSNLSFPTTRVGTNSQAQNLTVKNAGNGAASNVTLAGFSTDFVLNYSTCGAAGFTLPAGGTCSASVAFRPTLPTSYNQALRVYLGGIVQSSLTMVAGTGTGTSQLDVAPTTLDFGPIGLGGTGTANLTLTNSGVLGISTISYADGPSPPFSVTQPLPALGVGQPTTIQYYFRPTSAGVFQDTIQYSYTDTTGTRTTSQITLKGNTGAAVALNPNQLSGTAVVGGSTSFSTTVTNTGAAALRLNSILFSGATSSNRGFSTLSTTCGSNLSPGSQCGVSFAFAPSAAGSVSENVSLGFIDVSTLASATTATLALTGNGTSPVTITPSPNPLAFGSVTVGQYRDLAVQFTISGSILKGSRATVRPPAGPFQILYDSCSSTIMAAGINCSITVRYAPTSAGSVGSALPLFVLDSANRQVETNVGLSGTATANGGTLYVDRAPTFNFPNIALGTTNNQVFTMRNNGTGPLTLTNIQLGESPYRWLTMSQNCCSSYAPSTGACTGVALQPGAYCQASIGATPSQAGTDNYAFVVVANNGQSSSTQGTITATGAVPVINSMSPMNGTEGTQVVIYATNISGATAVYFSNSVFAPITGNGGSYVVTKVPSGAVTGPVWVVTAQGTGRSTFNFTVNQPAPTISSFSPTSATVGSNVTVNGTYLQGAVAYFSGFGNVQAATVSNTGSAITVTVPSGASTGPITLLLPSGARASTTLLAQPNFTLLIAPAGNTVWQLVSGSADMRASVGRVSGFNTFILRNNSVNPVRVEQITVPAPFSKTYDSCPPGGGIGSCAVNVVCSPYSTQRVSGNLQATIRTSSGTIAYANYPISCTGY